MINKQYAIASAQRSLNEKNHLACSASVFSAKHLIIIQSHQSATSIHALPAPENRPHSKAMAITCRGPPPLPPGKRFLQRASRKLPAGPSYRSFRDPALEAWIPPGQRLPTPRDDDEDDIDGFDLSSSIKICDEPARLDCVSFFFWPRFLF